MEQLAIGDQINIRRSDGCIQAAKVGLKNIERQIVTVEWTEGKSVKGKEIPWSVVLELNESLVKINQAVPMDSRKDLKPRIQTDYNMYRKKINSPPKKNQCTLNNNKRDEVAAKPEASKQTKPPARAILGDTSNRALQPVDSTSRTPRAAAVSNVVREVERLKAQREQRRAQQDEQRKEKWNLMRKDPGNPYWEEALMVRNYRDQLIMSPLRSLSPHGARVQQITVCVRKRPMSRRELLAKTVDIISVPSHDSLIVHELRNKVDLTKFLDHHKYRFDYTFDEQCNNALVYQHTAGPLIRTMFEGGNATCFAYGQTGSGKTHTMGGVFTGKVQDSTTGIYAMAAHDVFAELSTPKYRKLGASITCSYFEIYGSKVYDLLLKEKPMLRVLEDGSQQVVICDLTKMPVTTVDEVLALIEMGNRARTSGQTAVNLKSSRSHAVFQMALVLPGQRDPCGKCSFVDLAGNERGADTQSADLQTRREGAEINKSLLALKECIRALSRRSSHLPFRGSKLTQVLRDSFIGGEKNKLCMIAMISPGMSSVENTLNTLRYADRVKELIAKDVTPPEPDCDEGNLMANDENVSSKESSLYYESNCLPDFEANEILMNESNESIKYDSNPNIDDADQESVSYPQTTEIVKQHEILFKFIHDFKTNFEQVINERSYLRVPKLLLSEEPILLELSALVKQTHLLVSNYNYQRFADMDHDEDQQMLDDCEN